MFLDFPVELPDDLFTELDCAESSTQFAGFRMDVGRERLLRYSGVSIRLCPNEWVFFALLAFPPVAELAAHEQGRTCHGSPLVSLRLPESQALRG